MNFKKLLIGCFTLGAFKLSAFCGFYVAKADAKLFNKSSQVIIARSENQSVITMANDFQGDAKDFAMVVPVPVVLNRSDIKVVNKSIFDRFDSYSSPRLAEYYDQSPCMRVVYEYDSAPVGNGFMLKSMAAEDKAEENERVYKVKIEAQYEVGEYDILILSAKESSGLKNWLEDNGYKIPEKANEVLEPYIKDNLKFFVVKVNMERHVKSNKYLSPIQIKFNSRRFGLPIRLGMANSNGYQDMIVYVLSQHGRVETSNYRTIEMPSNNNVPTFIKNHFGKFYKSVFSKKWTNNKAAAFVEYSWDISSRNYVKCDPCSSTPPSGQDLLTAGANWLNFNEYGRGGANYQGNVHFTRLHVRYDRENFPQDLQFIETRNKKSFQCRYVLNHPAKIYEQCDGLKSYYERVQQRRRNEINTLADLTWWDTDRYNAYLQKYPALIDELEINGDFMEEEEEIKQSPRKGSIHWLVFLLLISSGLYFSVRKLKAS